MPGLSENVTRSAMYGLKFDESPEIFWHLPVKGDTKIMNSLIVIIKIL